MPLLEEQHKRVLAVLLTAAPSLTRDQFLRARQAICTETSKRVNALLTPNPREVATQQSHLAT